MTNHESFETKRLKLKPVSIEDAAFILQLMNTPKWIQFIGDRNVHTIDEAQNYIKEKVIPQLKNQGYSNNVVIRKSDEVKIGTCGLYHREGKEGIDIGFAFLPQHHGKGYALEAANKLMHAAKTNYGITELSGFTLEDNLASRTLLERLGFKLIGKGKLPNNEEDLLHYFRPLDF